MAEPPAANDPRADLQTAQNRMFPFVIEAMRHFEQDNRVSVLLQNPTALQSLFGIVRQQVFDLLHIPHDQRPAWHMGIADSGKRTIELLVNFLCPAEAGKNALLDTENYVGFNKFSAATALEKQKGVAFEKPFQVLLGRALTVNSETEQNKMAGLLEGNRLETLWVPWNSTSTGVQENLAQIVICRNGTQSKTLIIADAASLRLFSTAWEGVASDHLPDVFFFSLRKQGLPYDGPNDEFHQAQNSGSLIIFNEQALKHAQTVTAQPLYDCPSLAAISEGLMAQGEQQVNHVRHLLKLNCALDFFGNRDAAHLAALDAQCKTAREKILLSFSTNGTSLRNFTLLADPDAQSDSAYILKVPEGTTAKKVITALKKKGILISASMHPKMDSQRHVRFAFYPGNRVDEVECLLEEIGRMS